MAPGPPSKDGSQQPALDPLPPSIIAQAEAAIAGSGADESSDPASRIATNTKPDYSAYQNTHRPQGQSSSTASGSRSDPSSFLQVPGSAIPPPAYGDHHDQISLSHDGFDTMAKVTDDGRVNININQKTRRLSDLLVPALRNQLSLVAEEEQRPLAPGYLPPALGGLPGQTPPPALNVVIHVVGSRGDVQPFVALGKILKSTYGHRVRLATHPTFQTFVEENGLEFFSIGGDPAELMAFMVKNPGLMPGFDSLKSGDVGKRRKGMEEIVLGCWRSCIEAGNGLGPAPAKDSAGFDHGINLESNPSERPFIADAIIANPPSFAHVHIAEKMGIPLHLMFTMPWSPTQAFPHPLANIQSSNADVNMTNFITYALVEMMTWQGLGDIINRFRERALGLDPISLIWAPGMLSRLRIPYTYCWSPTLIPKPKDWAQHISISGFYFLSLASAYTPDAELDAFLKAGPPPVYIGFGSIVVDDPNGMTKLIFEAVKVSGVRALVSKGWGGLGGDALDVPEGVFMLGNVPHDWLFKHVSAVVHHGGAGTTAAGIALGRPTVIVPFFGDQPFWGSMVARAGAGPAPIPFKQLTAEKLATAITSALQPAVLQKAKEMGESISQEKGSEVGGKSFHDHLEVDKIRCQLAPSRVAVWNVKKTDIRLSTLAATVLSNEGLLSFADLALYRSREYETEDGPWDPISGGASALLGTIASLTMGIADMPVELFKAFKTKSNTVPGNQAHQKTNSISGAETPISRSDSQTTLSAGPFSDEPKASLDSLSGRTAVDSETASLSSENRSVTMPAGSSVSSSTVEKPASVKTASTGAFPRSSSPNRRPGSRSGSPVRGREYEPSPDLTFESAIGAGKGVSRIVGAGLKSPMDFTLGLARGFHNAPKLYGDDTVRPSEKVTGFQSGLKAAGKEFGYGFYDGISGLITQPLKGAEKEGAAGLIKGIGKGIGGLILKPGAAIWGLPGYTFMGIHKEIRKIFGSSVLNYVISARTAQGYEDWKSSTPEERADIVSRWHHQKHLHATKQQNPSASIDSSVDNQVLPSGFMNTRHLSFDERKRLKAEQAKQQASAKGKRPFGSEVPTFTTTDTSTSQTTAPSAVDETLDFEQAIRASVAATSRGDPEEDEMIERAIRASISELQKAQRGSTLTEEEALERAIKASVAEASHATTADAHEIQMVDSEDAERQAILQRSLQESLGTSHHTSNPLENDDVDTDDDENMKAAIEASKTAHEQAQKREKTEDEILLEAIQKQSLLEAEHKQKVQAKSGSASRTAPGADGADDDEDEDLKRAIEASLRG